MLALTILLSMARAEDCDANALAAKASEGAGDSSAKAFVKLSECTPERAKRIAPDAIAKFVPGKPTNKALVSALGLGFGEDVAKWLEAQQSDEKTQAMRALGNKCEKNETVQGFFLAQAESQGEDFWKNRWFKYLDSCPVPAVTELLGKKVDESKDDARNIYFAVMTVYAKLAGAEAIPTLEAHLKATSDDKVQMQIFEAFSYAAKVGSEAGMDQATASKAAKIITASAKGMSAKALAQARKTLTSMGDEEGADALAAEAYAGLAQNDGSLLWGVVVAENVVCKSGKKRQVIHYSKVVDNSKRTWGDQFKETIEANFTTHWALDQAAKCKGEGKVKIKVPAKPFIDEAKFEEWAKKQREQVADSSAKSSKTIPHDPLEI